MKKKIFVGLALLTSSIAFADDIHSASPDPSSAPSSSPSHVHGPGHSPTHTDSVSGSSSLTISGQVDAGVSRSQSATGQTLTEQGSQFGASRFRFVGIEDMGGGNIASFRLEMQPNMDTGSVNRFALFNRAAWVSLAGNWGSIRLGKQGSANVAFICDVIDLVDCHSGFSGAGVLFGGNGSSTRWISANPVRGQTTNARGLAPSTGAVLADPASRDTVRVVNGMSYFSPRIGGVEAMIQYAPSELPNGSLNGQGNSFGLNVNYLSGPLAAGVMYQTAGADPGTNASGTLSTLGGAYNFGPAQIGAVYQSESASGPAAVFTRARSWAITAATHFGAATPYLKFGQHRTNAATGIDSAVINIGTTYNLSKSTLLYADYAVDRKAKVLVTGGNTNPSIMSIGIQNNF